LSIYAKVMMEDHDDDAAVEPLEAVEEVQS